ncbi:DNA translocase FtsK [Desemzia sp. FAM 23989]|uniref:DNA translocase FtsK n=1 Tax=Desemzia sp. FAM 23989 TaxID=3259523 RepID=UPI0038844003
MAKYQGPVFHRQLQSERKKQTASPHEVKIKPTQSDKNDVPFYKQHETKQSEEPLLSSKGLKHKVTSYQEDRSSTPFKVKQVPSPFYGYKERREEKKESVNYAFIYENLSKQPADFLLFDEYLSELGEEQVLKSEDRTEETEFLEVLEQQENQQQIDHTPQKVIVETDNLPVLEDLHEPMSSSQKETEKDLNQEVNETSNIHDETAQETDYLVQERLPAIILPEESVGSAEVLDEADVDSIVKETKKRGLSRSLAGMIRDEQDERLNKGRNIARYFGETEDEPAAQAATISELLARAKQGKQVEELESLFEDEQPYIEATTVEENELISKEPFIVEADYTEIEELAAEEASPSAELSELADRTQQEESLDEPEEIIEAGPLVVEDTDSNHETPVTEEKNTVEEPVDSEEKIQEQDAAFEEFSSQPATITELLARAMQGEEQSNELEKLLEDTAPRLKNAVLVEEEAASEAGQAANIEVIDVHPTLMSDVLENTPPEKQVIDEESFIKSEKPALKDPILEDGMALDEQMEPETISFEEVIEETGEFPEEPAETDMWIDDEETSEEIHVEAVSEINDTQEEEDSEGWKPDESYSAEKQVLHYQYPSLDLLQEPVTFEPNAIDDWVLEQAEILNETLEAFNVEAQVVGWTIGPAITQFELQLGRGVKVNKITNLSDDLKLSLAAKDIRIEAPIPGKSTVGVEIPNKKSRPVMIAEVIGSQTFKNSESPLTIAMGVNLSGEAVVTTLDKMPHGLIAGATGSGKSVFINSLLVSLLYKATPNEVKLILIDPKAVELAPYNDLPHLLSPVISEPKAANEALKWAVNEMEERYQKLAAGGVRNIDHFNKKVAAGGDFALKIPYIVIIIDELADLMMVASNEVQDSIARITQKARAAGIHLIVATQRPSVDVVTGTIKNNIPTRVAFMVSSQVDSRTIIDTGGAEKLLGRGDMLFQGNGVNQPTRIQGTYVEEEIEDIVDFIKEQQEPNYLFQSESLLAKAEALEGKDDLFDEVLPFIIDEGTVSASSLQRKFRIGFNRASNLIDTLESENLISENKGSKPRDVFLTRSDYEEKFL